MPRRAPLAESVHIAALGIWLGAVGIAGVTAAITFPAMHALDPRLPEYSSYTGPHWLIAGGHIAQPVFAASDIVQMVCAVIVLLTFIAAMPWGRRSRALSAIRSLVLLALAGVVLYRLLILTPGMVHNLAIYWAAAREGNTAAAEPAKAAFDAAHPTSTRLMVATAALILVAIVISIGSPYRDTLAKEPR